MRLPALGRRASRAVDGSRDTSVAPRQSRTSAGGERASLSLSTSESEHQTFATFAKRARVRERASERESGHRTIRHLVLVQPAVEGELAAQHVADGLERVRLIAGTHDL